jgi:hypothetical protein
MEKKQCDCVQCKISRGEISPKTLIADVERAQKLLVDFFEEKQINKAVAAITMQIMLKHLEADGYKLIEVTEEEARQSSVVVPFSAPARPEEMN